MCREQPINEIYLAVNVEKESFSWAVDCSLGEDKTYGIKIADEASKGATFQYSFPFEIKGPSVGTESHNSILPGSLKSHSRPT